ncbi:MAG: 50S ribosomal protein L7/L12 [candidate division WOR-3 bacterium]
MTEQKQEIIDNIINSIESLTVADLAKLVSQLKEKFGITGAVFAPAGVAAAPTTQAGATTTTEETKTEYTVTLVSVGDKKIQVLKELRALTNLGLKEAKDMIDKTPSIIKEGATKEEAEKIKAKLEEVGAKVELK